MKQIALLLLATSALVASPLAMSQAFKCVGHDGQLSFSDTPCPPEQGNATWVMDTAPMRTGEPVESSAEIVQRSLRAASILSNEDRRAQAPQPSPAAVTYQEPPKPARVRTTCSGFGNIETCRSSDGGRSTTTRSGNYSHTTGKDGDGNRYTTNGNRIGNTTFENTKYKDD